MKLGAEPKKLAFLGGLVVIAIIAFYVNSNSDSPPAAAPRVIPTSTTPTPTATQPAAAKARQAGRPVAGEFRVRLPGTRPEDPSPESIDPKLKLELLDKVEAVEPIEGGRNLFQFGQAPPKVLPPVPVTDQHIDLRPKPPEPPKPPVDTGPPPPPPPAPITLKYYGVKVRKSDGGKLAFLQDGDDILFAQENEVLKQRYRIVKISPSSIDVEDIQGKNTQNLRLQDLPPS